MMRVAVSFIILALLCPAWAGAAAPERFGERGATLHLSAAEVFRWQQDDTTLLHLKGDVRIYQGGSSLTAAEAVVWFQEKPSDAAAAGSLTAYVEKGKISTGGTLRSVSAQTLIQSAPARGLVLKGLVSAAGDAPREVDFVINAIAFRRGEPLPKPSKGSDGVFDLLHPGAEEMFVSELQNGNAIVTLRGNAQIAGDNLVVKADTIRARVIKAEAEGGKTEYRVRSIYAEGAVEVRRDAEQVVAQSLYMDWANETALALDARVRGMTGPQGIPIQFHANTIRQMSRYRFAMEGGGYFSTSAFAEPHYRVQGNEIEVVSGPRDPDAEDDEGPQSMVVASRRNLLYLGAVPIFYWPYIAKDVRGGAFFINSLEIGISGTPGTYVRLGWDLYDLLYHTSKTSSLSLLTDYYLGRGPGFGLDFQYHTPERLGWARAYYVRDRSEFDEGDIRTPQQDRGEFTLRHREFLSEHLRLDAEVGFLSDRRFLRTYDHENLDNDKDRETGLFLRYMDDNWMATALARERINDFQNAVDREAISYHVFAEQIGDTPLLWTTHTDISRLRLRQDEDLPGAAGFPDVGRLDTAHELSLPFMIGQVRLAPYLWEDVTAYTRRADDDRAALRAASAAGVRAGTSFYRTFDTRSELLGVDGLRHVLTPTVDFQDIYHVTHSAREFIQHDEIDAVDEAAQVTVGLRNRLQTHRFIGGERTLTDFLTADLEYTELLHRRFPNAQRDSHADLSLMWQMTDNIRFTSADNRYNTDKSRLEAANADLTFSFWKPMTLGLLYKYYLDFQTAGTPAHSVAGVNLAWQPSYSRWKVEFQTSYDFRNNPGRKSHKLGTGLFFTRQLDDWAVRFGLRLNHGIDNETVFSFSVFPPGPRGNEHPYTTTGLYYY